MPSNSSQTSSSTIQANTAINPNIYAEVGGVALGTVNTGAGSVTNNVTNMDSALVARLSDNNLTATQDALLFGADAQRQAYGFSTGALNSSLSFATTSNANTMAFANAQTKATNATSMAAIGSAGESMDKALAFGARQTGVALDSLSKSATMIDTAYKDAKGVLGTNVILVAIGAGVLIVYFAMRK